ncbi:MAG TPA: branched-chain amino acid ABC transporter permease [Candidatus Dormibacteraeota bacterium]|jgi:branched-chain amino acid transport system permease protein|nr:branched-chain amino acid ABC transporter permease [Candidatus Dormibacteraeota bacterium]
MTGRLLTQLAAQAPSFYLQQGLNGIFSGSVYALFAVGYTLVFGVLDILNLAHSAVFMAGAVLALIFFANFGLPFWLAVVLAIAICGAIGYGLDLVAFRPLRRRGAPHISSLITSIAVALIFVSLAENNFGANSQRYPASVAPDASFHVGGVVIDQLSILILLVTLGLMAVLAVVIRRTRPGRAIRAVAENPRAAALMGINVDRTIALTLVISSALGGLAGILYGLSAHDISPYIGRDQVELKGLAVIVVGGMGSITGAVVAGYLLGLIEVVALVTLGSNVRTGVAFAVLFLALVLFPSGLFGRRRERRT